MLLGTAIASRVAAVAMLLGAAIGVGTAIVVGAPAAEIYAGLWGYDASLVCVCIMGLFYLLTPRSIVLAIVGSIFATLMHGAVSAFLAPVGMPALTFPAALVCFTLTSVGSVLPKATLMPLSLITVPEEHFCLGLDGKVHRATPNASKSAWRFVKDLQES